MRVTSCTLLLLPLLAPAAYAAPSTCKRSRSHLRRTEVKRADSAEMAHAQDIKLAHFALGSPGDASSSGSSSGASASGSASASDSAGPSSTSASDDGSSATSTFTGIPVATGSGAPEDYLPASSRVLQSLTNVNSQSISSMLAQTTGYSTFTYTTYEPTTTTTTETSWATQTSAPASGGSSDSDDGSDSGSGDGSGSYMGVLQDAMGSIQSYANSLIGKMMPTMTLEVVLEPTQVSADAWDCVS